MLVLGIETSCDETAAAVVENGNKTLSNVVASQNEVHAPYGGIVPELASRRHVENIPIVIREALKTAKVELEQIDLFAVTRGPGLLGALLVGLSTAKALAWSTGKPLVPVHHLHGHAATAGLERDTVYPHLCLLVSGGHTSLYKVSSPVDMEELASTRDDAAGEAFDKAARMLGLGYPGGPALEKAARKGDENKIPFTLPNVRGRPLDFSFSGLKTAVRTVLRKKPAPNPEDVAASFQKTVIEILQLKTAAAAEKYGLKEIVVAGGVARNEYIRNGMRKMAATAGYNLFFPKPDYCTDNAAMIAAAGFYLYSAKTDNPGFRDFLTLDAVANLKL